MNATLSLDMPSNSYLPSIMALANSTCVPLNPQVRTKSVIDKRQICSQNTPTPNIPHRQTKETANGSQEGMTTT